MRRVGRDSVDIVLSGGSFRRSTATAGLRPGTEQTSAPSLYSTSDVAHSPENPPGCPWVTSRLWLGFVLGFPAAKLPRICGKDCKNAAIAARTGRAGSASLSRNEVWAPEGCWAEIRRQIRRQDTYSHVSESHFNWYAVAATNPTEQCLRRKSGDMIAIHRRECSFTAIHMPSPHYYQCVQGSDDNSIWPA
jgi:hypothetical protein